MVVYLCAPSSCTTKGEVCVCVGGGVAFDFSKSKATCVLSGNTGDSRDKRARYLRDAMRHV